MTKTDGELRRYQRPRLRRSAPFRDRARGAFVRLAAGRTAIGEPKDPAQAYRRYDAKQVWGKALTLTEASAEDATFLRRFTVLEDRPPVWDQLMELSRRHSLGGRQVRDAPIAQCCAPRPLRINRKPWDRA